MATIIKREKENGKVSWQVKVRRKGWPSASRTFDRKKDADAWADSQEKDLREGKFVDLRAAQDVSIKEALDRYESEVSSLKRSYKNEKKTIKLFSSSTISARTLANLSAADVAKWRDDRLKAGLSPYSVRNELALLSHLFTVAACEWGHEGLANPVKSIKRPKPPTGRDRRLKPSIGKKQGELDILLTNASSVHTSLGAAIEFAIETAMRVGEITQLRPSDIDLRNRVAHLRETKAGEPRDVPLSAKALKILKERIKNQAKDSDDKPLFELSSMRLSHYFGLLTKNLGIKNLRFHDLRHEATSRLFEKGLNPMQVATITGHKTLIMLKRYTHLRAKDLVELLD